jgi:outer membrane protein, heavy metal efflux system
MISRTTALALAASLCTSCLAGATAREYEAALRAAQRPVLRRVRAAGDDTLAREARLPTILQLALARSPDVAEAEARVRAALERVPGTSRLPDLELKQEISGVPLRRPYALDQAQMLLFGLRQTFPAPGAAPARSRAALEEARAVAAARDAREQDLATRVRRVYLDLYRAEQERSSVLAQLRLVERMQALARVNQQVGRGAQQDVLRLAVEATRLRSDLATLEQQTASDRALLNAYMARSLDAPLGPLPVIRVQDGERRVAELERRMAARLPELAAARSAVRRSEALLASARAAARWPSLMLGVDYWLMPTSMGESIHGYGAMIAFNLPWISPRRRDDVHEAEAALSADRRALEAAANLAGYQLRDAYLRHAAARRSLALIDGQLLAEATRSYEAAAAAFVAGQGDALGLVDALRALLQTKLDRVRALVRAETALADLERAAGSAVPVHKESDR